MIFIVTLIWLVIIGDIYAKMSQEIEAPRTFSKVLNYYKSINFKAYLTKRFGYPRFAVLAITTIGILGNAFNIASCLGGTGFIRGQPEITTGGSW